mgnify:CR=1 FL=1
MNIDHDSLIFFCIDPRRRTLVYVTSMEEALVKKDEQSESTENEFQNEKEELQQHLVSFQEQISGYQQQQESLQKQIQKYQQQDQSRQTQLLQYQQLEERHNEIMLESESLKHQLQELQNVVEEQSNASRQYPAHLEKEMQERLAQRWVYLFFHLHPLRYRCIH